MPLGRWASVDDYQRPAGIRRFRPLPSTRSRVSSRAAAASAYVIGCVARVIILARLFCEFKLDELGDIGVARIRVVSVPRYIDRTSLVPTGSNRLTASLSLTRCVKAHLIVVYFEVDPGAVRSTQFLTGALQIPRPVKERRGYARVGGNVVHRALLSDRV